MKNKLIIVTGGTASGKTTIADKLLLDLKDDAIILKLDDYYLDLKDMNHDDKKKVNFDHPSSFEWSLLKEHVSKLLEGQEVEVPVYDFVTSSRKDEVHVIKPKKVIILEGILSAYMPEINELASLIVFVSTASDIRLLRRIKRDVNERGRKLEDILCQWENTVKPMHNEFIEPTKKYAHVIIPEGGENEIGLKTLYAGIAELTR